MDRIFGEAGFAKFTDEVQHFLVGVLLWEPGSDSLLWRAG